MSCRATSCNGCSPVRPPELRPSQQTGSSGEPRRAGADGTASETWWLLVVIGACDPAGTFRALSRSWPLRAHADGFFATTRKALKHRDLLSVLRPTPTTAGRAVSAFFDAAALDVTCGRFTCRTPLSSLSMLLGAGFGVGGGTAAGIDVAANFYNPTPAPRVHHELESAVAAVAGGRTRPRHKCADKQLRARVTAA